jgi:predicted PurR-regulated permease PerM
MSPLVDESPNSSRFTGGWTRGRIIFLAVSGALLLALLWWASEVLLPFVLALIIAYVLTPLVALVERGRVPRAVSILLVYAVVFGILYFSIATIAPRIYEETAKFARDTPTLASRIVEQYGPRFDSWLAGLLQRGAVAPRPPPKEPLPAIQIKPMPDGSYAVHLGSGVDVVREDERRWQIVPVRPPSEEKFSLARLVREGTNRFFEYVRRNSLELIRFGQVLVSKVAKSVFLLFMTLMVAGYIMLTRETIIGFFRSLIPPRTRLSFDHLLYRIDRGLSGVVRGQLLICLVNGVLSAIGFWMFGLKYWPILSIVAAVMSLVPIFGSILSTIPAVIIGLTQDFWTALWVLLWVIGIHQVEANLLNPKIIGVAAKIHPVIVVFALLTGEHFFGLWGALLAVPAWSLAQSVFLHFRFEALPDSPPDSLLPPNAVRSSRA